MCGTDWAYRCCCTCSPCGGTAEADKLEKQLRDELRRTGMLLSDPDVLCAMEHSALEKPCYLPIAVKDGQARGLAAGVLADAEQMGKMGRYVDSLLRQAARAAGERLRLVPLRVGLLVRRKAGQAPVSAKDDAGGILADGGQGGGTPWLTYS